MVYLVVDVLGNLIQTCSSLEEASAFRDDYDPDHSFTREPFAAGDIFNRLKY